MKTAEAYARVQKVLGAFEYPPHLDLPGESWYRPGPHAGVRLTQGKKQRLEIGLCGGIPTLALLNQLAEAFHVDPNEIRMASASRVNIDTEHTFDESHMIVLTLENVR